MEIKRRFLSLLLAICLVAGLVPTTVYAVGMKSGVATLTSETPCKVAFAGHEWWVIGYNGTGIYSAKGDRDHVTLLAANHDFGTTAFRTGGADSFENSTQYTSVYSKVNAYYANNPGGMDNWIAPCEYAGSTLQQKMVEIANGFPAKEQAMITPRDLASEATSDNNGWTTSKGYGDYIDGIAGQGISDQKLWAIAQEEMDELHIGLVMDSVNSWWLRSPYGDVGAGCYGGPIGIKVNNDTLAARPALCLNLSTVVFSSYASDTDGKASAAVGGGLVAAQRPLANVNTVKFTMKDASQTLTVHATAAQSTQTGETLSFTYSNATTGGNQYVSCVLTDEKGNVKYYGKLANCADSSAASGNLSVPLSGVADGTYTLQIFSEEANGDLYTDFCSQPVVMRVAMNDGMGTVREFKGTIHDHSWSTAWSSDDTHHWHDCTKGCPITDNSQKDGYAAHTFEWITDREATATEKGAKHERCTICGYAKAAVEIPATGRTDTPAGGSQTDDKGDPDTETTDVPQTGDTGNITFWVSILLVSGAALAGTVFFNRKKRYSR